MHEIMQQIESGVLVHPQNDRWHDFFKFLKSKTPNDVDVPNPLGSGPIKGVPNLVRL